MKTLDQFHKLNPVVAEGVRVLNALAPATKWTYLTYRSWVMGTGNPSAGNRVLLFLKGIKA